LIDDGFSSSEWWSDAAGLDSEVYGDPDQHPQKENDWGNINPIGIRACYDEGKRAEETLCSAWSWCRRAGGTHLEQTRSFCFFIDLADGLIASGAGPNDTATRMGRMNQRVAG
jgi:hypothetical protein